MDPVKHAWLLDNPGRFYKGYGCGIGDLVELLGEVESRAQMQILASLKCTIAQMDEEELEPNEEPSNDMMILSRWQYMSVGDRMTAWNEAVKAVLRTMGRLPNA